MRELKWEKTKRRARRKIHERERQIGRETKELIVEASHGKSRSFTCYRKKICAITPNVDVNKIRKGKDSEKERRRRMNIERRKR